MAVDVAVQNYAATISIRDGLMLLVEQIKQVMEQGLSLPEATVDCGWQRTENSPLIEAKLLLHENLFTSIPRFTYLTRRPR